IRMINPHAGGGKGMYFIPEIGEEVLVGFEAGNAEKPFVLGAMYNGSASSAYATSGNDKKVIQTRSGCKIIIDDAVGSIFLEDPSGNSVLLDGNKNISINAPKNFTVNAGENIIYSAGGNIVSSAQKNINIIAGESITELANEDYSLTASNIFETAQIGRSSKAKSITENMEKGNIISSKEAIHVESAKEVNVNSGKKVNMQ
ncbi:phage baseplate assembly protein V, partial [Flavobacterium jumunjinense]